jgi:hypothetical protein
MASTTTAISRLGRLASTPPPPPLLLLLDEPCFL